MEIEMKRCLMITSISFILLFIYYVSVQPDYVKNEDELSIRICTVYALMFSSSIGLLYLCSVIMKNALNNNSGNASNAIKVESPTFN